jgi:hypothetical protein
VNRRQFFARTAGVIAAAVMVPRAAEGVWAMHPSQKDVLKFKGVPIVFDPTCPTNRMYFVNPKYSHQWTVK